VLLASLGSPVVVVVLQKLRVMPQFLLFLLLVVMEVLVVLDSQQLTLL